MTWLLPIHLVFTGILLSPQAHAQAPADIPAPLLSPPPIAEPGPSLGAADNLPAAAPAGKVEKKPDSPVAGWEDGFYLRSADKKFNLKITGQIQTDFRGYLNARDQTDIDTFLVRRARLGVEATVAEIFEFRLLPDFGQGQARIQDSYLNLHFRDALQLEIGKFKQPFSYEQLIQDRFVPTMERSLLDQLVPARDVGLMLHGQKLLSDRFDYAVAISNGQQNGDGDLTDSVDLNARIVARPFAQFEALPFVRWLQIGGSTSVGHEFEAVSPNVFRTPGNVPWFRFLPGVLADGIRTRWSPEVSYFYHGLGVAAQYLREDQQLRAVSPLAPVVDVRFDSYYVMATLLLTGEERTTYSKAIAPLRPFDPKAPFCSPGAWELVARVSRLRVSDNVFAGGPGQLANPALVSPGATELTVGMNWYLNKWVRTQFNWEHAWFDRPVTLGTPPAGVLGIQNTLLARLQVIF